LITAVIIKILRGDQRVALFVGDRVRAPVLRQGDAFPAVRVAARSGTAHNHATGHSGLETSTLVVDAYSTSPEEADLLERAIFLALTDKQGEYYGVQVRSLMATGTPSESSEASKVGGEHDLFRSSRDYEVSYLV
jgi:hypothetical protein